MEPGLPLALTQEIVDRGDRAAIVGDVHSEELAHGTLRARLHVRAVLEEESCPVAEPVGRAVSDRTADDGPACTVPGQETRRPAVPDDAMIFDHGDVWGTRGGDSSCP